MDYYGLPWATMGYLIRGQAPDSKGGVILKGLVEFRGETQRVGLSKGGIQNFDQF